MRLTERVSKRIDFAKERRAQGRSLNTAVRELARLIEPVAQQHGIDLQARLKEASARKSEERRLLANASKSRWCLCLSAIVMGNPTELALASSYAWIQTFSRSPQ